MIHRLLEAQPSLYRTVFARLRLGNTEKRTYLSLVKCGDTVVEAGANRGYFTRLFAMLVGAEGVVHAFEPVPVTFAVLEANVGLSPWRSSIRLHRGALGDRIGEAEMHMPEGDDGQASLSARTGGALFRCPITTLDAAVAGTDRLDFLKCDVEGAERLILRGGAAALRRFTPLCSLEACAGWTSAFGYEPDDLVEDLRELGYDLFFRLDEVVEPWKPGRKDGSPMLLAGREALHGRALERLLEAEGR